jgi:hypothetical protein
MLPQLRIAALAAVAMAAAGCSPDAPPAPPIDGGPIGQGLSISWESRPATFPGSPSADLTIERAVFHQDELRVVRDAGPIDLELDELVWERGVAPAALPVMGALPGLYSRLLFELEGDDDDRDREYAYEITGTVRVNGTFRPFTIRDTGDLSLSLDFSITLPPGGTARIPVRIEIDEIVTAVDFSQVQIQDNRYIVEKGNSQLTNVRAAVRGSFGVSSASGPS